MWQKKYYGEIEVKKKIKEKKMLNNISSRWHIDEYFTKCVRLVRVQEKKNKNKNIDGRFIIILFELQNK